jgi:putative dehydrogenase
LESKGSTRPWAIQWHYEAYRWIAEMEEIAGFVGEDDAGHKIFAGATAPYERMAEDFEGARQETGALTAFVEKGKQ